MPRMAIVHEWVHARAGSEQVFEAMAAIYPDADLVALSYEPSVGLETGGRPIRTTFLDHPALRQRRGMTLPAMPAAWRALGRGSYDVVLSSHHAFAHTNRLTTTGAHLCYVHSPARYVWSPDIDERGKAWYLGPARAALRTADRRASTRVTRYAANSSAVAHRIQEYWDRAATVIHPPVRVDYFSKSGDAKPTRDYVLGVGRWIPYKNLHLVVDAANKVGLPVKIAGNGPDRSRILAAAERGNVPVQLVESPSDGELRELYRNAACLVFPTVEDFGIVPVEAQAAGVPVVTIAEGGALDTVVDGVSGVYAETLEPGELAHAIIRAVDLDRDGPVINSRRFSVDIFNERLTAWVGE